MSDVSQAARVQLCGTFAVELDGRSITRSFRGRQDRMLFTYLVLRGSQAVPRDALVDALWGEAPPGSPGAAVNVLVSRLPGTLGPELLRGRTEISLVLPQRAEVDVEIALAAVHTAESAVCTADWP
jgi:DNA-binding SARP family transcriptional activator